MDVAQTPDPSVFEILVDAVPKTPSSVQWLSNRAFQLNYIQGALGPSVVRCSLDEDQTDFQSALFIHVEPFDIEGVEQTTDALWINDDPNVEVQVLFTPNLSDGDDIEGTNVEVSWGVQTHNPNEALIQNNNEAIMLFNGVGVPTGNVNIAIVSVDSNWKTVTGMFLIPFLDSNIEEDT